MMQKEQRIKRRTFFKVTTVAGGGFLLGMNMIAGCGPSESIQKELELPDNWVDMNAFIKIGDNGVVTIYSPNPEIGQNVKTSMPMIVAEELDVDWNNVIVEQAGLDTDAFTRQVAGGSQSIRQGWTALREAGATIRQMLILAAANQWSVDPGSCTTENGFVVFGDQKIGYGELASGASEVPIPEEVELKEKADFKIIGTPRGNVDIDKILTGAPMYGIDTVREGMVYAVVLRPPAFGQELKDFQDTAAKNVNGVLDVIKFGNKIAVIANKTWPAIKGKNALTAQWSNPRPLEDSNFHDQTLGDLLDKNENQPFRNDGDVEKALADADQVISRTYTSPFLPHNCMEPMNFFADVREDGVELFGPIQTPAWTRQRVAELLERPEEEITVGMSRMGGGFGRRLYGDFALEAAEISSIVKKPVQLIFTREDDMKAGTYRPAIKYKIEAAIKDGDVTAYRLKEAAINSNMYGLIPNFFPAGAIPNYQVIGHKYDSEITTGAWRAPYTNFLAFAEQTFFDEIADIIDKDPIDLRLELLERAIPVAETDDRIEYSPERLQGVLRLVAEKAGWGKQPKDVFQGVSAYYSHNTHVAEIADVILVDGQPVVKKVTCAVDCGIVINPEGAINQVQGGIIDGIGHAMFGDIQFDQGQADRGNFDRYRLIRNGEAPEVDVHFVKNDIDPTGLGEPSLPPAGGAVANAIFKATGIRMYNQPFIKNEGILG